MQLGGFDKDFSELRAWRCRISLWLSVLEVARFDLSSKIVRKVFVHINLHSEHGIIRVVFAWHRHPKRRPDTWVTVYPSRGSVLALATATH